MPATFASEEGARISATPKVCITQTKTQSLSLQNANDHDGRRAYKAEVSKTRPQRFTNWFLSEWMDALGVRQRDLIDRTGYNKTTVSHLVSSRTDYSPTIVRDVAQALQIAPWELFLPPSDVAELKKLVANAATAAELAQRIRIGSAPPSESE